MRLLMLNATRASRLTKCHHPARLCQNPERRSDGIGHTGRVCTRSRSRFPDESPLSVKKPELRLDPVATALGSDTLMSPQAVLYRSPVSRASIFIDGSSPSDESLGYFRSSAASVSEPGAVAMGSITQVAVARTIARYDSRSLLIRSLPLAVLTPP